MASLSLPAPVLQFDPPGPAAVLEKPVNVKLGPVLGSDGVAAAPDAMRRIGAYVYRVAAPGGAEEIWNEAAQAWQASVMAPVALGGLQPIALAPRAGDASPWQGVLVAAGQKDGAGAPRYAAAQGGFPLYRLRALAEVARGGAVEAAVSPASGDLTFVSASEKDRFRVSFDTGQPADCTSVRLALKNAGLVVTGFVELRAAGPEVEIAACDPSGLPRLRVLLNAAGDIELRPAAGRRVIVQGDLEAEHIRYLPAGGGAKQDLP